MSAVASQSRTSAKPNPSALSALRSEWIPGLVLAVIVVVTFLPALKNGFIWDDDLMVTENPLIKAADGLKLIWFTTKPTDFFPLTYSDMWVEWRLFGMNAAGYHLTNVLLHAANALLLWRLLKELRQTNRGFTTAWFGAALFAVHPVNVATVAWIAEKKNTLSMLFALLSVMAYLRSEKPENRNARRDYILALICFGLSLLAKTAGVALPVILLGIAWWKRGLKSKDVIRAVPFFIMALVMGLVTIWFQNHRAWSADFAPRDLPTRLAGVGWAIWFYVWKALLPVGLVPIYPLFEIEGRSTLAFAPDVLLVAAPVVLWLQQKRFGRAPLFVVLGFILMLLPVSGLLSMNYHQFSLVADHWQYFALPFATAAIAWGVAKLVGAVQLRDAILGVGLAICAVLANQYTRVFNGERIWPATLEKNPTCWIASNNLGEELEEKGKFDEALASFKQSLKYHPGYRNATMGIASTYLRLNNMPQAIEALRPLAEREPDNLLLRYNLGSAYLLNKQPQLAIGELEAALQAPPSDPLKRSQWSVKGMSESGIRVEAQLRLGNALASVGRKDEALKNYFAVLEADPNSARAHYQVAGIIGEKHDRLGARQHLREVIRLNPDAIDALNDLAWNIATDGQATAAERGEAKKYASHAADVTRHQEPGILDTLAASCAATGEFEEAVKIAKEAQFVARSKGDTGFVTDVQKRIELYSRKQAYTE